MTTWPGLNGECVHIDLSNLNQRPLPNEALRYSQQMTTLSYSLLRAKNNTTIKPCLFNYCCYRGYAAGK